MTAYETILFEKKGQIATITLSRPEKLNVRNPRMGEELLSAFKLADEEEDIRVLVITGAGRAFCAGADVRERFLFRIENRKKGVDEKITEDFAEVGCLALSRVRKPVIASINGAAFGLGCTLAVASDIRIASEKATFGLPFGRMSLPPEFGSTYFLPRLIGIGKACELIFTGKTVTAQEALEMGLVNRVVPHEKLMEETMKLARTLAGKPPLAVRMMKRAVYQGQTSTLRAHLDYISSQLSLLSETKDHQEAAKAFLGKRKPRFEGR